MKKYSPDVLYKGMTRPAMKMGMPYLYAVGCLPTYVFIVAIFDNLTILIASPFIMIFIGQEIVRRDVHLIDIYWAKIGQKSLHPDVKRYWKSRTYRPG